jgi:hypothetical protein
VTNSNFAGNLVTARLSETTVHLRKPKPARSVGLPHVRSTFRRLPRASFCFVASALQPRCAVWSILFLLVGSCPGANPLHIASLLSPGGDRGLFSNCQTQDKGAFGFGRR